MLEVNCLIFSTNIKFANVSIFFCQLTFILASATFIAYHNANKQFHVTHDSKHDSVAMASGERERKKREVKEQKVQLAFCNCHFVCGFFTLIGPLRHIKNAPRQKRASREKKKMWGEKMWKVQCEKMTVQSIIHVEHRSNINQFPFFIFTLSSPSPSIRAPLLHHTHPHPYPYGTHFERWVRISSCWFTGDTYWSAYRICHFNSIDRIELKTGSSISQPAEKKQQRRHVEAQSKMCIRDAS